MANNTSPTFDVIVVGAGIAGASLAATLGKQGRKVLIVERDLAPPDTFRGELLMPGGIRRLKELGLDSKPTSLYSDPHRVSVSHLFSAVRRLR